MHINATSLVAYFMNGPRSTAALFVSHGARYFCFFHGFGAARCVDDLAHAWDAHGLRLPLSKFERLPRDVVLFRVLDRVQVNVCLLLSCFRYSTAFCDASTDVYCCSCLWWLSYTHLRLPVILDLPSPLPTRTQITRKIACSRLVMTRFICGLHFPRLRQNVRSVATGWVRLAPALLLLSWGILRRAREVRCVTVGCPVGILYGALSPSCVLFHQRARVTLALVVRIKSPEWLPEEISHHVMPLAKRYALDLDVVLLDYMRM